MTSTLHSSGVRWSGFRDKHCLASLCLSFLIRRAGITVAVPMGCCMMRSHTQCARTDLACGQHCPRSALAVIIVAALGGEGRAGRGSVLAPVHLHPCHLQPQGQSCSLLLTPDRCWPFALSLSCCNRSYNLHKN